MTTAARNPEKGGEAGKRMEVTLLFLEVIFGYFFFLVDKKW